MASKLLKGAQRLVGKEASATTASSGSCTVTMNNCTYEVQFACHADYQCLWVQSTNTCVCMCALSTRRATAGLIHPILQACTSWRWRCLMTLYVCASFPMCCWLYHPTTQLWLQCLTDCACLASVCVYQSVAREILRLAGERASMRFLRCNYESDEQSVKFELRHSREPVCTLHQTSMHTTTGHVSHTECMFVCVCVCSVTSDTTSQGTVELVAGQHAATARVSTCTTCVTL